MQTKLKLWQTYPHLKTPASQQKLNRYQTPTQSTWKQQQQLKYENNQIQRLLNTDLARQEQATSYTLVLQKRLNNFFVTLTNNRGNTIYKNSLRLIPKIRDVKPKRIRLRWQKKLRAKALSYLPFPQTSEFKSYKQKKRKKELKIPTQKPSLKIKTLTQKVKQRKKYVLRNIQTKIKKSIRLIKRNNSNKRINRKNSTKKNDLSKRKKQNIHQKKAQPIPRLIVKTNYLSTYLLQRIWKTVRSRGGYIAFVNYNPQIAFNGTRLPKAPRKKVRLSRGRFLLRYSRLRSKKKQNSSD